MVVWDFVYQLYHPIEGVENLYDMIGSHHFHQPGCHNLGRSSRGSPFPSLASFFGDDGWCEVDFGYKNFPKIIVKNGMSLKDEDVLT